MAIHALITARPCAPSPTRRALLAGLATLPAASAFVAPRIPALASGPDAVLKVSGAIGPLSMPDPASGPDAVLIAACAAFDALEQQIDALYDGPASIKDDDERDAVIEPLRERQDDYLPAILDMRATTMRGHIARARAIASWDKEMFNPGWSDGVGGDMKNALIRDLLAIVGQS